jgi:serine/threonine protein kinase
MELLKGGSLKTRLAEGPLDVDEILDIALQVTDALGTAHDHGIMHRDLTPGNIFLTDSGLVKLLDFGLAKHFASFEGEPYSDDLTAEGTVAGTVHYMAPEQFSAGGVLDRRGDLFSLGAVLYQLATGTRPFEAAVRNEVATLIQQQPHVPIRHFAPHQPAQLERIIDQLLAKHPDHRYQSAQALAADLDLFRKSRAASVRTATPAGQSSHKSIAVLPFRLVGPPAPTLSEFRDGLVEDLCSRFTAIRDLRIAPRTSTDILANQSIRDIGRGLRVSMILEGSVQQAAGRVRVVANLVNAEHEQSVRPALVVEHAFDDTL